LRNIKRKKRNSILSDKDKITELEMENEILKKYLQFLKEEEKGQSLR
jgi:transposase